MKLPVSRLRGAGGGWGGAEGSRGRRRGKVKKEWVSGQKG